MEADDSIMKIVWSSEIGTMILNEIITAEAADLIEMVISRVKRQLT